MKALFVWLQGKKTYLVAGAIAVAALGGVFMGKLSFAQATALLGFAGAITGLGAKLERHATQVTAVLADVAEVGADAALHRYPAAETHTLRTIEDTVSLAMAVEKDKG